MKKSTDKSHKDGFFSSTFDSLLEDPKLLKVYSETSKKNTAVKSVSTS